MITRHLLHISDSHFCERSGRLDETITLHHAAVAAAAEHRVDLIVHSGDLYDRASSPAERAAAADFLATAADVAPVVLVRGNHDAPGDLPFFARLRTRHPLFVAERPTTRPGSAFFAGGFGVVALPWFDRAHIAAGAAATDDADSIRHRTIAAARQLLDALRLEADRIRGLGLTPVLVGHVQVAGSETSTGQTLIGQTVELAPADLAFVEYAALGHIHKNQAWYDGRVAYSGSPQRFSFGEPEVKGCNLITLRDGAFERNEFITLPARRIELLEEDWTGDRAQDLMSRRAWDQLVRLPDSTRDCLVRLRYRIRPEDLARIDEASLRRFFDDAYEVKLEAVVVTETRARVPEIVETESLADKVRLFLASKSLLLSDAEVERVLAKLAGLEIPDEGRADAAA